MSEFWQGVVGLLGWAIGVAWCVRTTELIKGIPTIADLSGLDWSYAGEWVAEEAPRLVVVVPARDEAEDIAATMEALLESDYPRLEIVAVDDRSIDGTGKILDGYGVGHGGRVRVIHVSKLEEGWLGKTWAMQTALAATESEYVLFTDADVLMSPTILRRAVAYAEEVRADHLVVFPTMLVKTWGEGVVLGFFQVLGLWATRPWRVGDPKAKRDAIGVGAFNLVRRDALEEIGGLEPQRMVVLEDVTLGRRMKAAGMRQRVAFAPGLVLVHWASGARGLVEVMTKNMFSSVNFRVELMVGACLWIVVFCLLPIVGLGWWTTVAPSLMVMCCMAVTYRTMGAVSGIDARYGWLYPLGALTFVYAMLRSMVVTWMQGGVRWRGTFYPLKELRKHNSARRWRKAEEAGPLRG
jgi:glycosyltransferase involved in cell wall biosynthesis